MNMTQIENNLQELFENFSKTEFIYDFLLCYDFPKSTLARIKSGSKNKSKIAGEMHLDNQLHFKEIASGSLNEAMAELKSTYPQVKSKKKPRFLMVTDFINLSAFDTKTADSLDIELTALTKHFDFFLPLAGMEKSHNFTENPADVKAAEKMAKLYDAILKDNPAESKEQVHALNIFLTRLLFCFFAEDTGIFSDKIFVGSVKSHTQEDGSDLSSYIERIFTILNQKERSDLPEYLLAFPYVNGGLFAEHFPIPCFSRRSRNLIIECGDLCWAEINPDIFGSMIQAVITPEHRGGLGMHYTSVPNIMKVIKPLFLDELQEEFAKCYDRPKDLDALLSRIGKIKIFDPACGSGNFLIIAYKELRLLEIKIMKRMQDLYKEIEEIGRKKGNIPQKQRRMVDTNYFSFFSQINLTQFYGIELDDFAHEVAILSLWLAEHQMNMFYQKEFGQAIATLPLKAGGNIVCGNACRLAWEQVCPKNEGDEIYILGNPPFLGKSYQDLSQKNDMQLVFNGVQSYGNLDYVACWFKLGIDYALSTKVQAAFVSTNSICQGIAVAPLWNYFFIKNCVINFAYRTFKWSNGAKANAAVHCVIIGFSCFERKQKIIFENGSMKFAKQINAYLLDSKNIIVESRLKPLSDVPNMTVGSCPADGGHLIMDAIEYNYLNQNEPSSQKFIHPFIGSDEFINDKERYCLWLKNINEFELNSLPLVKERVEKVRQFRLNSKKEPTRKKAQTPHRFTEERYDGKDFIIIPMVSSENRKYVPIGFCHGNIIASNLVSVIPDATECIFSFITSNMCMVWMKTVGSRLKSDFRFSASLVYNTFPFPPITEAQKEQLTVRVHAILEEREKHSEKNLAELYDPDKMPDGLREAHRQNDLAIEQIYRQEPFISDEERLEWLFKLYEEMIAAEKLNAPKSKKSKNAVEEE